MSDDERHQSNSNVSEPRSLWKPTVEKLKRMRTDAVGTSWDTRAERLTISGGRVECGCCDGMVEVYVRWNCYVACEACWRESTPERWSWSAASVGECVHQVFRKEGDRIVVAPGALREWPHIAAILAGTVAGDFRDWPKVRAELLDFIRVHQCGDSQFVAGKK